MNKKQEEVGKVITKMKNKRKKTSLLKNIKTIYKIYLKLKNKVIFKIN